MSVTFKLKRKKRNRKHGFLMRMARAMAEKL